jgi:glycosyltransferase involved in cell wall biosynthesis
MESMPAAAGSTKTIHALLGRPDSPTDGVADYCNFLGAALAKQGVHLDTLQLPWMDQGWPAALRLLRTRIESWRGEWALLQYTALAWSRRGFPLNALRIARILQKEGVRLAVVFHDAVILDVLRIRDRARRHVQHMTMRNLYDRAEQSILTVPPQSVAWLPANCPRANYIPIGANIPAYLGDHSAKPSHLPTIAIFSITGGETQRTEVQDIAVIAKRAKDNFGALRLEVFGRGCLEARLALEDALQGTGVAMRLRGILPAEEITRTLAGSDALLCVRGHTTSRRGTAIAGIACGLPVFGYGNTGSDPAIDAAGVCLAPWRDPRALAVALVRVLSNAALWRELHQRSLNAEITFFSWDSVAERYLDSLSLKAAKR